MDSGSWNYGLSSASSRRYQFRSDPFVGGHEEMDADEDLRPEFLCPFCAEDFDIVGLCCHIDEEHPVEVKNGVCPICAKRAGMDFVGHITMQHANFLKVQHKRRFRKGGSNFSSSRLRKELVEANLQSLIGSSSAEPDPLLSSFIYNLPEVDDPVKLQSLSSVESTSEKENLAEISSERNVEKLTTSDKDKEEKARKCKFVQGLLISTILDEL